MDATTLLSGILGGLILNVMPCVFPVLFLKVSSLIEHTKETVAEQRYEAIAYLGGTFTAFAGFAAVIIALRASGQALGWGMQMQSPAFVASMVLLLFIFGLNALGVFEIRFTVQAGRSTGGRLSSFVDGLVITLVSTPCSAPFLGGAAAAALATGAAWYETLALFWSIGFGLALPVLMLAFVPALNHLLPRPGAWMNTLKALTGFTLLGAAVWLFGTLARQIEAEAAQDFLWFVLLVGLALWAKNHLEELGFEGVRQRLAQVFGTAGVAAAGALLVHFEPPPPPAVIAAECEAANGQTASSVVEGHIRWTPFTEAAKREALDRGRPVFVDFTADWCASCKVFEKSHVEVEAVRKVLDDTLILAAKADLTRDEGLWEALNGLGRSGLPTYVIFKPDGTHDLLPEGPPLTLIERLLAVGQAFPPEKFTN